MTDGTRVYYQSWSDDDDRRAPQPGLPLDRGTVVDNGTAVLWDTGECDPVAPSGWCRLHSYRALPLGSVPDVAPSIAVIVARWDS